MSAGESVSVCLPMASETAMPWTTGDAIRDHSIATHENVITTLPLAAGVDMSMGVDDVRQRVGSIDDGLERTRFGECGQGSSPHACDAHSSQHFKPPRDGRSMAPII